MSACYGKAMMLETLKDLSPRVEYYSIDEFFFQAVCPRGKTFSDLAVLVRDRMWEVAKVPVTVGIARTRTLAKLLSDASKPFGARAVLDGAGEREFLRNQPVTEISGI
ncbi:MAG TPA: nucleotidyltransferase, partial [Isosphaeraceae bacterium]|nr:nucleotidyltransferase [Isosphaeraceae bacterium]